MTVINSLIVIIQDRVNHLNVILKHYDDGFKDSVVKEIEGLEEILDILVGLDD